MSSTLRKVIPEVDQHSMGKTATHEEVVAVYGGLCASCVEGPNCTFPKDLDHPPIECGEYVPFPPSQAKVTIELSKTDRLRANRLVTETADSGKFPGLCASCDKQTGCTFPKPEGGVWHCVEYR
jgi:hypothetical protein